MHNPFEKFTRVWTSQELLDYAFSKSLKYAPSTPPTTPRLEKIRRKEIKRIENTTKMLINKIRSIIESVPNLDELPIFYRKLSHLLVNNDELKRNLGRLNGVIPVLQRLEKQFRRRIGTAQTPKLIAAERVQFFGRVSSVIKKQEQTLQFLESCRKKLMQVPPVNLTIPSVVVAGYPNVGKSSIVGKISSAKPQISEYPFTTKQIYIGVYKDELGSNYFQVIDTPGVLDRPMSQRNEIEQQAILALNTIATVVLYVFDPTTACGFEIEHQLQLFNEIRDSFLKGLNVPIFIVINKIDFAKEEEIDYLLKALNKSREEVFMTNALTGENIDALKKALLDYFKITNFAR